MSYYIWIHIYCDTGNLLRKCLNSGSTFLRVFYAAFSMTTFPDLDKTAFKTRCTGLSLVLTAWDLWKSCESGRCEEQKKIRSVRECI